MERSRSLRKGDQFDTVYQKGTVLNGPLFVLRWYPNQVGRTRWGFAVGKKLAKSAVVRNTIRRRLKEAARPLPVPEGYDVILTAKQPALKATVQEFGRSLEKQLARAKLLGEAQER